MVNLHYVNSQPRWHQYFYVWLTSLPNLGYTKFSMVDLHYVNSQPRWYQPFYGLPALVNLCYTKFSMVHLVSQPRLH
jgi:hypothetical protein